MSKSKTYIVFFLLLLLACQAESSELKTSVLVDEAVDKGISFVAKKTKSWFGKSKKGKEKVNKKVVDEQDKKDEQEKVSETRKAEAEEGLNYLDSQLIKLDTDKDGDLSEEDAKKVASNTKRKYKVFQSIKPIEEGGKWTFEYKYNPTRKKKTTKKVEYKLSKADKELARKIKKLPGGSSLAGYIESTKVFPWFKHGFKTQAERAIYYDDQGRLVDIEQGFTDPKTGKMSRFDLVIKDVDSKGVDNGKEVVVEVKNWTGFVNLEGLKRDERLTSLESQLKKYKASKKKVLLEWKGVIPEDIEELCDDLNVDVKSI